MRVIVRRRPDGLVQIARAPRWRLLLNPVTTATCCLVALCGGVVAALVATLVAFPLAVGLTVPFLALGAWAGELVRSTRIPAPQFTDPPPRRAA
jgi:hypothetical protein